MGLVITDPEDPEDVLYFCLVDWDISNVQEIQRVTSLEVSGKVDNELISAFTAQGGVLNQDMMKQSNNMITPSGMAAAIKFTGAIAATPKAKAKAKSKVKAIKDKAETEDGNGKATVVTPPTPLEKAKELMTKILKDAATCRHLGYYYTL